MPRAKDELGLVIRAAHFAARKRSGEAGEAGGQDLQPARHSREPAGGMVSGETPELLRLGQGSRGPGPRRESEAGTAVRSTASAEAGGLNPLRTGCGIESSDLSNTLQARAALVVRPEPTGGTQVGQSARRFRPASAAVSPAWLDMGPVRA